MEGPKHWHGSIEHIVYTALGVLVVFQVTRHVAGWMVSSQSSAISNTGKAIGGLFSFPSQ